MVHMGKRTSKRKTLRQKYSLQKAKSNAKEKMRKLLRKNPEMRPRLSKKDPGVPNLFPFKDALLDQAERRRERIQEEQEVQRERRRQMVQQKRQEAAASLLESSQREPVVQVTQEKEDRELMHNRTDLSRRGWYLKELRRCVDEADIILEVLDARDPMGCRCLAVEKLITGRVSAQSARPKRIILVLNKVDLVPPEVAAQWVDYLRADFPCIAFKASTQRQGDHLGSSDAPSLAAVSAASAGSVGAGSAKLLQLLKDYSVHGGVRAHINVGVIGYPNVGKSSVINTLKRSRAVGVSPTPGFTKEVSSIKLDKNITLLDSPGVLFSADESKDPGLVLRNCLRVESIEDPIGAVRVMLDKCPAADLMKLYNVPAFANADEFLFHVASQRGKLRKGGVPDLETAARLVLQDWNDGAIQYYTLPPKTRRPKREQVAAAEKESAEVVDSFAPEFDIDKIVAEHNAATLAELRQAPAKGRFIEIKPTQPSSFDFDEEMGGDGEGDEGEDDEGEEDDDEDDEDGGDGDGGADEAMSDRRSRGETKSFGTSASRAERKQAYEILVKGRGLGVVGKAAAKASAAAAIGPAPRISPEDEFNKTTNRNMKMEQKAQRKKKARDERRAARSQGAGGMEASDEGEDDEDEDDEDVDVDVKPAPKGAKAAKSSKAAEQPARKSKAVDFDAPYNFDEDWND